MFTLAILIGIYSYIIFSLGLAGLLSRGVVLPVSIVYFVFSLVILKKYEGFEFNLPKKLFKDKTLSILILILIFQGVINLIGVLGPELGFDALWYHLTLPKIYLQNNAILHIPGGLLYYSDMPKLAEMLYTAGLIFGNETVPKLISFSFGILSCLVIYKISKKYLNSFYSFLSVVIFYSNLVVGWQSITAYVDLPRTFFEVMTLWGFLNFFEKKEKKWLILSAAMLGLAISTKLLSLGSIAIFVVLIAYFLYKSKEKISEITSSVLLFFLISLLIPLPWFIFSYVHTGSPIYPFFSSIYPVSLNLGLLNLINFMKDIIQVFIKADDPISPLYLIVFPLIIYYFKKFPQSIKLITIYSLLSILIWYFTPRTGGGRFMLPYLPAFSILVSFIVFKLKNKSIHVYLILIICVIAISSILYRGIANSKYLPVVFGKESRENFLSRNLNFAFGDFYDIDGYFEKNIKIDDKVLLYGFHNLYYVNFPFIDSSWIKKGDTFNYIAVQNPIIPERFSDWNLIYDNSTTKVKLYTKGGIRWAY